MHEAQRVVIARVNWLRVLAGSWLILAVLLSGCYDALPAPPTPSTVPSRTPVRKTRVPTVHPTATASRVPPARPTATVTLTPTAEAGGVWSLVTTVVDGDTIHVEIDGKRYRVRLIGIDTPEWDQYGYERATAATEELCGGQSVRLVKDVSETDRYGRLLRYIYLEDGTFVNAEIVRRGYATAVTFPPDVRHVELLRQLEREARLAERGLWAAEVEATADPG